MNRIASTALAAAMLATPAIMTPTQQASAAPRTYVISGSLYADANYNRKVDRGEKTIAKRVVYVVNRATGKVARKTTTNARGAYAVRVPNGSYRVYAATTATEYMPHSYVNVKGKNVRRHLLASTVGNVSGVIAVDANGNGRQDRGEGGVAGRWVTLHNAKGKQVAKTRTGKGGVYTFKARRGIYTIKPALNKGEKPLSAKIYFNGAKKQNFFVTKAPAPKPPAPKPPTAGSEFVPNERNGYENTEWALKSINGALRLRKDFLTENQCLTNYADEMAKNFAVSMDFYKNNGRSYTRELTEKCGITKVFPLVTFTTPSRVAIKDYPQVVANPEYKHGAVKYMGNHTYLLVLTN